MTKAEVQPGSSLVFAHVNFYQGLRAGTVGEVPNEVAELAIKAGYATPVDSLEARVKTEPKRVTSHSDIYPRGTTGPQDLADKLEAERDEGTEKKAEAPKSVGATKSKR